MGDAIMRLFSKDTVGGLVAIIRTLQEAGKKLVVTNGCFDILHPGHVDLLERCKAYGDILLVMINSDESVRKLKGEGRPINNQGDRAEMLLGLKSVDYVYIFEEESPRFSIPLFRPEVYIKGGDYGDKSKLRTTPVVEQYGGNVVIEPLHGDYSTTKCIERIVSMYGK